MKKNYKERGCLDASYSRHECIDQKAKGKIDESKYTSKNWNKNTSHYYGKARRVAKKC